MSAEPHIIDEPAAADEAPGLRLRAAREAAGRSQLWIAEELRLSVEIIDALECGDATRLPSAVFVRGYLRSYAAALGLPGDEIVEAYHRSGAGAPPKLARRSAQQLVGGRRGAYLLWLLLLVLALGAAWWWQRQGVEPAPAQAGSEAAETVSAPAAPGEAMPGAGPAAPAQETAAAGAEPVQPAGVEEPGAEPSGGIPREIADPTGAVDAAAAVEPPGVEDPGAEPSAEIPGAIAGATGAVDAAAAVEPARASATDIVEPTPPSPEVAPPVPPAEAPGEEAPPAPADADVLELRFAEASWVEVRDGRGQRLLYRLAAAGEAQRVSGTAPFRIVLGNAPAVELSINGEAVDVGAYGRGRTVRFELGSEGQ